MMSGRMMAAAALAVALCGVAVAGTAMGLEARQPADVAAKLTGEWMLNRGLSSGFGTSGRGPGRGALPSRAPLFAAPAGIPQRGGGGRGGDPTDLTPEERAEQAAMRQLQQIAERMTIKASADSVTFIDSRGERTYAINDKSSTVDVGGSPVKVKSKWDKRVLRQEFSNNQARLVETWAVDDADRLVLTAKVESLNLVTPDRKAVFDRR